MILRAGGADRTEDDCPRTQTQGAVRVEVDNVLEVAVPAMKRELRCPSPAKGELYQYGSEPS